MAITEAEINDALRNWRNGSQKPWRAEHFGANTYNVDPRRWPVVAPGGGKEQTVLRTSDADDRDLIVFLVNHAEELLAAYAECRLMPEPVER